MDEFSIIPSNYNIQNFETECKRLLTYLKGKINGEGFASIKSYSEDDGYVGIIVKPDKGVVVFKMISDPNGSYDGNVITTLLKNENFKSNMQKKYNDLRNFYLGKIMHSKSLCVFNGKEKKPKFPIKFALVYQDFDPSKIKAADKRTITLINKNIYFRNFESLNNDTSIFANFEPCDKSFKYIERKYYGSLVERIIPEYTTLIDVVNEGPDKAVPENIKFTFSKITGNEREFSALALDDSQIRTINETKSGPYITLANPGTGKSVILVSKAYRIYSKDPKSKILITCYNRNLRDHHSIFAQVNGLKGSRLQILTFNSLVEDLLMKTDKEKYLPLIVAKKYDEQIEACYKLIKAKKIKPIFDSIFIDEVQLFDPTWIDMCYCLLKNKGSNGSPFEMYGDINQDVKSQRSKGKASWQNTKSVPSLTGRVRSLDKNYRNTQFIANYLNAMITSFNSFLKCFDIYIDPESSCLTSVTGRQGTHKPKIYPVSQEAVGKRVAKTIQMLKNKYQADESEIAVIYTAKSFGKFYHPLAKILAELDENCIPYSMISGNVGAKTPLYATDGVIISTIDSSLGLDFKYVIICGLHYWDFFVDPKTEKTSLLTLPLMYENKDAAHYFNEIGKKIYAAVSRARDRVFIVDDSNQYSVVKKIIMPKGKEDTYNVKFL